MKNYYLLLFAILASSFSIGQTTIVQQDFETTPTTPTLNFVQTGAGNFTSGSGLNPSGNLFVSALRGYGVSNGNTQLTFASVNASTYSNISLTFRLSSPSNNPNNGSDTTDEVQIFISTNDGVSYSEELIIAGNSNSRWNFTSGTGIATLGFDGNNTPTVIAPSSGGNQTTEGYSTINLTNLPNASQLRVRIVMTNNSNQENWIIDDVKLTGTLINCTTTPINVSALTAAPANAQVDLNWTNSACFDEVLVVAKQGTSVTATPTGNGSTYTANAIFGNGTQIVTDEYVVYKGTGTNVNVTALTNGTNYHFRVFTRKGSVWSSGVVANATPNINYCTATSSNTNDEFISRVQLNTINNASGANNYTYYASISTDLSRGSQQTITVTPTWTDRTYSEGYGVWIDYNQDGVYAASERVMNLAPTTNTPVSATFTVPTGASLGTTRMRVILRFNQTPDACDTFTYGEVEDYNVNITPPITYVFNNGWSPSDPNGASTSSNDIIIANGNAIISSDISANSVTVSSTASLTVNTGNTFTVLNDVNMDSNSVNYSSLIVDGTLSANVTYTRHINGQPGVGVGTGANDLISAPVTGQTFLAFVTANPNLRSNPNNADQKLFGPFSKSTGTYLLWNVNTDGGTILAPGIGYRTATTDNGGFIFSGTANNGIITNNIVNSGPSFAQWNLIGNPYPSYINVFDFLNYDVDPSAATVRNIDLMTASYAAIYGYDGNAAGFGGNGYTVYNLANAGAVNLAPGQGFLVTADAAKVVAHDINFAPSMRRIGNTDDFIPGRLNANNVHIKLQAIIDAADYSTLIYFNDVATSGMDFGYDASVYGNSAGAKAIYSQLVQDNMGADLAIQSLAYADLGTDIIVPLGINVPQGQQVTVSIAEMDLPANIEVYLEDNVTGIFTLLNISDYVFTPSSNLTETGRFFLRFSDRTLSTNEVSLNGLQIFATATPRALFIKGQLATATTVSLYDIQGRMVLTSSLDISSNSNQVNISNLSSGVYVVKLNNATLQKTQKVILK